MSVPDQRFILVKDRAQMSSPQICWAVRVSIFYDEIHRSQALTLLQSKTGSKKLCSYEIHDTVIKHGFLVWMD